MSEGLDPVLVEQVLQTTPRCPGTHPKAGPTGIILLAGTVTADQIAFPNLPGFSLILVCLSPHMECKVSKDSLPENIALGWVLSAQDFGGGESVNIQQQTSCFM